jgi:cyclopropane-fatty-acyl-phospholipid synthase
MDRPTDQSCRREEACTPASMDRARNSSSFALVEELFAGADIRINGDRPWDMVIHDPRTAGRLLADGSLGLGESYMDGWWDCAELDRMLAQVLVARLEERVSRKRLIALGLANRILNRQSRRRSWRVAQVHYDLGQPLFGAMLDRRIAYSCGYWAHATSLEEAQAEKLERVCRKLGLRSGMRLLDIGCGWGSLMRYAAERFHVHCVGLTVSAEQFNYVRATCTGLPIEVHLRDYRDFGRSGEARFDRIASIGMFEHVGHKNYHDYFEMVQRCLRDDGLFLLHTIGKLRADTTPDPWIDRYIFPNHALPTLGELAGASEGRFVIEDVDNFGADYERTLLAWHANLEQARPQLSGQYDERFFRMMRYYLLVCAAAFRARINQVYQLVLSPHGVPGGYRRPAGVTAIE